MPNTDLTESTAIGQIVAIEALAKKLGNPIREVGGWLRNIKRSCVINNTMFTLTRASFDFWLNHNPNDQLRVGVELQLNHKPSDHWRATWGIVTQGNSIICRFKFNPEGEIITY